MIRAFFVWFRLFWKTHVYDSETSAQTAQQHELMEKTDRY